MTDWTGKRVAVVGLGARTGVSVVRYLHAHGATVYAYDQKPERELRENLSSLEGISFELEAGKASPTGLRGADLIVLSPGVPIQSSFLREAAADRVPIWSEIELAGRELTAPILAVTGTNGKSTTTSLLAHLLERWGKKVFAGGNLGIPLVEAIGRPFDFLVVEISSFQMEAVEQFHPRVGVLLNLSENHLDRHGDMKTYRECKSRLFARMEEGDRAIFRSGDSDLKEMAGRVRASTWFFSGEEDEAADIRVVNGAVQLPDGSQVSLGGFRLPGRHNRENAAAAIAAAHSVGCPAGVMAEALSTFKGLPHRLEEVGVVRGVRYINDSKSTTPDAAVRALEAFGTKVLLLAGGKPKGARYDSLGRAAERFAKKVFLFGPAADSIKQALKGVPNAQFQRLRETLHAAAKEASPGDIVLLSPANASFDEFVDYEDRGRKFAEWVRELSEGVR